MRLNVRLLAGFVAIALAAGGAFWLRSSSQDALTAPALEPASSAPPAYVAPMAPTHGAPPVVIGEYRPDTAGLLPTDAPLFEQIPALRAAAARGNATAACRLAVIGLQCTIAGQMPASWAEDPAFQREAEAQFQRAQSDTDLDAVPEGLRAYAQQRIDIDALAELDQSAIHRAWHRRCMGAPTPDPSETLAFLRQAALAGEPRSMARYVYAEWMGSFVGVAGLRGFSGEGSGMAWSRAPAFDAWRREAMAVRRAGLERGDPEMLRRAFNPGLQQALRPLAAENPIDTAAALRAYAHLATGRAPESTATLGLSPEVAAEADRLADTWASRARERGSRVDAALLNARDAAEVPSCQ